MLGGNDMMTIGRKEKDTRKASESRSGVVYFFFAASSSSFCESEKTV